MWYKCALFILVMEPYLRVIYQKSRRAHFGAVRACADDLGAVINNIRHLHFFKLLFDSMQDMANLKIESTKCNIVPVHNPSPEYCARIKEWININLPDRSVLMLLEVVNT